MHMDGQLNLGTGSPVQITMHFTLPRVAPVISAEELTDALDVSQWTTTIELDLSEVSYADRVMIYSDMLGMTPSSLHDALNI
jgi:hypothetical protein